MTETEGTVSIVHQSANVIGYTNSNEDGLSGAPMYSEWGGVRCYGVHIAGLPSVNLSMAVKIYPDLFNVIVDYMSQ